MNVPESLLLSLRTWGRTPAGDLLDRLQVSRPTLMRSVRALGTQVMVMGQARRTAYAARRGVRGRDAPLPLFRIDASGRSHEAAVVHPIYPAGCAVQWSEACPWPLEEAMTDGWFDGLPYFLEDMRPQGFLGRHFAQAHALMLQVPEDPQHWSEDDILHALSLMGMDLPGCFILGEPALQAWLASRPDAETAIDEDSLPIAYPQLAQAAMVHGVAGSSAGGEFPKFTAVRRHGRQVRHVIVKFSAADTSAAAQRWSDLLVCEHLAGRAMADHLDVPTALSQIHQVESRTFLEVERFDRHGARGRSPVCSWAALNAGLFGLAGRPWTVAAQALSERGMVSPDVRLAVEKVWHFGQLIANSDMHDGNLSFRPGLQLAPVYDMLPMHYAPLRAGEVTPRDYAPTLPLPSQRPQWEAAAVAAQWFWSTAAGDRRISRGFRVICARNAKQLRALMAGA